MPDLNLDLKNKNKKPIDPAMQRFHGMTYEFKFADGKNDPVQVLKTGEFSDPRYGKFQITPVILLSLKKNFDENVRGIDLAIDYAHKSDEEAAAWIKSLELRNNNTELWATPQWTDSGRKTLASKDFRYLSADFTNNYIDNESGKEFGPTLLGAGLTNRPVIKGMQPIIQLAEGDGPSEQDKLHEQQKARSSKYGIEITSDTHLTPPAGYPTDEAEYADPVNFKYPIDNAGHANNARARFKQASGEYSKTESKNKVHERIVRKELSLGAKPSFDAKDPLDAALPEDLKSQLTKPTKASEGDNMDPKDKEIADLKAQLAALQKEKEGTATQMGDFKKQLEEYKAKELAANEAKVMAEKKTKFDTMLSEGKVVEAQREPYMQNDMGKFTELAQPLKLSEIGNKGGAGGKDDEGDAQDKILKLAQVAMKDDKKLSQGEAIRLVLADSKNKEIATEYRNLMKRA